LWFRSGIRKVIQTAPCYYLNTGREHPTVRRLNDF